MVWRLGLLIKGFRVWGGLGGSSASLGFRGFDGFQGLQASAVDLMISVWGFRFGLGARGGCEGSLRRSQDWSAECCPSSSSPARPQSTSNVYIYTEIDTYTCKCTRVHVHINDMYVCV